VYTSRKSNLVDARVADGGKKKKKVIVILLLDLFHPSL